MSSRLFENGEEFYVLKFPLKLWRIVNECSSGAIRWDAFGKSILIDYNHFQAEYLECPVPKFKTRNMTSFVRQLNMYGFKKMQTQQRNVMSRYCNIHEFFNEFFRLGRPDLLCHVKRRTIPLKMEKMTTVYRNKRLPRSEICKKMFEDTLMTSPGLVGFWKIGPEDCSEGTTVIIQGYFDTFLIVNIPTEIWVLNYQLPPDAIITFCNFKGPNGEKVIQPKYQIRVIPALSITTDAESETAVAEVISNFEPLSINDPNIQLDEPEESDTDEVEEDGLDPTAFEISIPSCSPSYLNWMTAIKHDVNVQNIPKKKEYILDVPGSINLPTTTQETDIVRRTSNIENVPRNDITPFLPCNEMPSDENETHVLFSIPEKDEEDDYFFSFVKSITNSQL